MQFSHGGRAAWRDVQRQGASKKDSFLGGLDTLSGQATPIKSQAPQVKNSGEEMLFHAYEYLQTAV